MITSETKTLITCVASETKTKRPLSKLTEPNNKLLSKLIAYLTEPTRRNRLSKLTAYLTEPQEPFIKTNCFYKPNQFSHPRNQKQKIRIRKLTSETK